MNAYMTILIVAHPRRGIVQSESKWQSWAMLHCTTGNDNNNSVPRWWHRWRRHPWLWWQSDKLFENAQIPFEWGFNLTFALASTYSTDGPYEHRAAHAHTEHPLDAVYLRSPNANEIMSSLLHANYVTYVIVNGELPLGIHTWARSCIGWQDDEVYSVFRCNIFDTIRVACFNLDVLKARVWHAGGRRRRFLFFLESSIPVLDATTRLCVPSQSQYIATHISRTIY